MLHDKNLNIRMLHDEDHLVHSFFIISLPLHCENLVDGYRGSFYSSATCYSMGSRMGHGFLYEHPICGHSSFEC